MVPVYVLFSFKEIEEPKETENITWNDWIAMEGYHLFIGKLKFLLLLIYNGN